MRMRFRWNIRAFWIVVYLCIVVLIALHQSYYDTAGRSSVGGGDDGEELADEESDDDFDDAIKIVGSVPADIGTVAQIKKDHGGDRKRTILMWTSSEIGPQHLGGCPDYDCEITTDRRRVNTSDAIVFHNGVGAAPRGRNRSQFYVFFTQESPVHMGIDGRYSRAFFNLTLGFRRDADVPCPYGYAVKRKKTLRSLPKNLTNLIAGKDRPIAWFVSNCGAPSGRDKYVDELKKYIDVDIYGSCGTMSCSKSTDCNSLLERKYKFYLAFENSLCKDYATEKFWEKMTLNIVTVVLKRSIVDASAPPNSFIAADDFESPRALAAYLKQLDEDPVMYRSLFEWRRRYRIVFLNGREHGRLERPWCFCKLCRRLLETKPRANVYKDINDWWSKEGKCDSNLVPHLLSGKPRKS